MKDVQRGPSTDNAHAPEEAALSRRRFVKGAMATAPVLATLPSGAALARSSNIIGYTSAAGAVDRQGRTLCLDPRYGDGAVAGGVDLGDPPYGKVNAIPARDWRVGSDDTAAPITESEMCARGGSYYYKTFDGIYKQGYVWRGGYVSATALASFAGSIYVKEI
jgi:hypothetical protein